MTACRLDSDEVFLAYLVTVNPSGAACPCGWDVNAATSEAKALHQRMQIEFGDNHPFDGHPAIQDATFHANIYIPGGVIRLSNFEHLAAVTHEESVPLVILSRAVLILEEAGYTYIPFRLFGEPFATRERCNGDLFSQLFDW